MMKYYLTVKNYTEAMRGKSYLKGLNINCNVEKVSGKGGCGYAVVVGDNPERASRLLSTLNITVLKIESGKSDGLNHGSSAETFSVQKRKTSALCLTAQRLLTPQSRE